MIATRALNLVARFLGEPIEFHGCTTVVDLEKILREYDEGNVFPDGVDCTYTQFFFPIAFAGGFRLGNYAEEIFRKLSEAAIGVGTAGVPMEHVALTVEMLLLENRTKDVADFAIAKEQIESAVLRSNLQSLSGVLGAAQRPRMD
jgi:hypothetical protein